MAGGSSLRTQLRALQTVPEVYRSQNFLCQPETEDADVLAARLEAAEESEREQQRKYRAVFIPVDPQLEKEINCEILNTDIRNYPWKETPFGDVYYSPRYSDERYTYRHVILSRGVRKEAEKLASTMPDGLLTEDMFIHCLGIALSPGWTHFMCFNRKLKELILRRPREDDNPKATQGASKVDGAPGEGDERSWWISSFKKRYGRLSLSCTSLYFRNERKFKADGMVCPVHRWMWTATTNHRLKRTHGAPVEESQVAVEIVDPLVNIVTQHALMRTSRCPNVEKARWKFHRSVLPVEKNGGRRVSAQKRVCQWNRPRKLTKEEQRRLEKQERVCRYLDDRMRGI
ncbi:UNVERIFIED_CONTAM: cyclin-dependent kinase regulatory subunit protein [Hammondia hammondi]|eukprot:XP_008889385.1 cyclin-dependent kinase regulatory subunit protein [Hammondia hammondi]